jgi:hypothetical protein
MRLYIGIGRIVNHRMDGLLPTTSLQRRGGVGGKSENAVAVLQLQRLPCVYQLSF